MWHQIYIAWLLAVCACGAQAAEPEPAKLRCGWFENPTPANAWLTDRDGEWIIAVQGGYQAVGDWPTFRAADWVQTGPSYGYGCACIKMVEDTKSGLVRSIVTSYTLPLQRCRKDPSLTEPKHD